MGRRRTEEAWMDILKALNSMGYRRFTASELSALTRVKYETVRRILALMALVSQCGSLYRIKNRPQTYIWIPHKSPSYTLKSIVIRRLLINETVSIDELSTEFNINRKFAKKILDSIVKEGLAEWIERKTIVSTLQPVTPIIPLDLEKPIQRPIPQE